ncbi:hypothetical protein LCGC14_1405890 [marine sediment metagenome]|uniref:Zinc finger CHC2-type domain-containing protein n=1 Tax=marine sediment metagenome TaxID=412755 RepID=A0A0F9MB40_9ZZZZ
MTDKIGLMLDALIHYDVDYNLGRAGWQGVRCPVEWAHVNADQNPSARLNLTLGLIKCLGCELNGDAYSLVMAVDNVTFLEAKEKLGNPESIQESDWLI